MYIYPEDSVLHRHVQSALHFNDVSVPDIPQDSVLPRHAVDNDPVVISPQYDKIGLKPSGRGSEPEIPEANTHDGFFAWLKRLFGGG